MTAPAVAEVIRRIHDAAWLPQIASWEIAQIDGVWGAHGHVDADDLVAAVMAMTKLASEVGAELAVDGRLLSVSFTEMDVPVRVLWFVPIDRWIVPETCATCPTKLGGPGVQFVRIGVGVPDAPVICVPCRDRMHREFVAGARTPAVDAAADFARSVADGFEEPVEWGPAPVYPPRPQDVETGGAL